MDLPSIYQYPVPSAAALKLQYIGKDIQDVDPPAAIIDRAVVRKNCNAMLEASTRLSIGFRAHVKTHKVSTSFLCPSQPYSSWKPCAWVLSDSGRYPLATFTSPS